MKSMKTLVLTSMIAGAMAVSSAQAAIVLFEDTFSDTGLGGSPNATPNASVSGTYAQSGADNYAIAHDTDGGSSASATESGGLLSFNDANNDSTVVTTLYNYAADANVQSSGELTVTLTDINPTVRDWFALDITSRIITNTDLSGNSTGITKPIVNLGTLFGTTGATQVFSKGSGAAGNNWSNNDITFELTNISGFGSATLGAFDYDILSGAVSIDSGSVTGLDFDTGGLYVGMEGRGDGDQTLSALSITTVPEPSAIALLGLGLCGLVRRRRN